MFGLFERKTIADQLLRWGDARRVTCIRRKRLERCDITITCPASGIILKDVAFHDCTIRVRRKFLDHQFFQVAFDACRFVGDFSGCEFGYRKSVGSGGMRGYARNCDFSETHLDFAAFNGADMAGIRLPPWPHFLIKSPAAYAAVAQFADDPEWSLQSQIPWPPEMTGLVRVYRSKGRDSFSLPADEALAALRQYPDFIAIVPQ